MKKILTVILLLVLLCCALSCVIAEEAAPTLVLSKTELQLDAGKSAPVKAKVEGAAKGQKATYTWISSDEAVATVKNGNIKGVGNGEAVITCTAELKDGPTLTAEVKVQVLVMVKSIQLQTKNLKLGYGQTEQIAWTVKPENALMQDLDWTSSDVAVATVDAEGKVTGGIPGKATITGTAKDGSKKSVKVPVTVTEEGLPATLGLLVSKVSLKMKDDALDGYYIVINRTGKTVKHFGVVICHYDKDGKQIFVSDENEFLIAIWYQPTNYLGIRPGKTDKIWHKSEKYAGKDVDRIRIAVCWYILEDGTAVYIPDSHMYWYDSADGYGPCPAIAEAYQNPGDELYNKIEHYTLGFYTRRFYSPIAMDYMGSNESGIYVVEIVPGSVAERVGLQLRDLIVGIDEIRWKDEPCCVAYAYSRLVDGQAVTFHIIRNGEKMDIVIRPEDTEGWEVKPEE
ncbi:MAG: Ig-like domain-containing protein [Clostridiales bacterium]|nr:Ig-like domain-containing protein [Clostridiales bacterium]